MKTPLLIFFLAMCLSQWYVPGAMIVEREDILKNGRIFRFKTAPVDPSDPFRGKYITLDFEADVFKADEALKVERGDEVFVMVEEDSRGFARVKGVAQSLPEDATDYLTAEVSYKADDRIHLEYPFERFYLEESKASKAEQVYWEANRADSAQTAYAVVRIRNGKATLQDVLLNDRSIADIVRELNAQPD